MKKKIMIAVAFVVVLTTLLSFSVAAAQPNMWFKTNPNKIGKYEYAFALVGDTQVLAAWDAGYPAAVGATYDETKRGHDYMKNLYKWIVDNKEEKKIEYVFGLGDITQNSGWGPTMLDPVKNPNEWNVAKEAIDQLNGVVPYSMVRGNHDHKGKFLQAFDTDVYKSQFEGYYNDVNNTYRTFYIGQEKYLFITLDFAPTKEIIDWANGIVTQYPDHRVIVTTHGYMNNNGTHLTRLDTTITNGSSETGTTRCYNGDSIWEKFISKHENIFMIICGHIGCNAPQITQITGEKGNTVYQVLVNPQDYDAAVEPIGTVALLCFTEDGSTFYVQYYSTVKDMYYNLNPAYDPLTRATVVYSEPRFTTTAATTTAVPTTAELTTVATTTAADEGGCGGLVIGMFTALPVIACTSAMTIRKRKKR